MKKILILANNDMGLYNFRKELLERLLQEGYEVYISLPDGPRVPEMVQMGCRFVKTSLKRRGKNPMRDGTLFFCYLGMMKKIKPDLVLTYTIKPNIYGGLAARIMKIPYLANITGLGSTFQKEGILKSFIIFLYKIALKTAATVFFENQGNYKVFTKYGMLKPHQECLLSGAGVNLKEYIFQEYPAQTEKIIFLFIGRIMKEKGIDELLEVAQRIQQDGELAEFHFVGFYEENYQQKIKSAEQKGIIRFWGYQTDVKPFILQSHCFVLPSYHEGMANTLLESAAMGRPLITSDIFGCKEAVCEGKNGYLCKAKDAESLYQEIKHFLKLSYEEKAEMGKQSRLHIEKNFDKVKVVETVMSEIQKIL